MARRSNSEVRACLARYYNFEENHFKGRAGTGERFENCIKAFMRCHGYDEDSARRICAYIYHRKYS